VSIKSGGLSSFVRSQNQVVAAEAPTEKPEPTHPIITSKSPSPEAGKRIRIKARSGLISVTIRLTREQWKRLHELALMDGSSLQSLAVMGLSRVFEDRGLPPL